MSAETSQQINVKLPDGSIKQMPRGATALDVAKSIGQRLADAALSAQAKPLVAGSDGGEGGVAKLIDLTQPLNEDTELRILTERDPESLEVFRHSSAHLLATAVLELFPETKLGHGPPTESGFVAPNLFAISVEWLVPVVILVVLAIALARRSERERRAAGVVLGVATVHVFGAFDRLAPFVANDFRMFALISAAAAVIAATAFRWRWPAVLTQLGLLGSAILFAATLLQWLDAQLFANGLEIEGSDIGVVRPLLTMAWWIGWAVAFGVLALRERTRARSDTDTDRRSAALRRVSLTRFCAALTLVGGITVGAFANNSEGRILAPWLSEVIVLLTAGVLIGVAIRLGSSAYLYPAALAIIIALSDLDATYIAERTGTGAALIVEGLILIGAGFAADRLRRRLDMARVPPSVIEVEGG